MEEGTEKFQSSNGIDTSKIFPVPFVDKKELMVSLKRNKKGIKLHIFSLSKLSVKQ